MRTNKKGAFSITALIMGVITLIAYASLLPVISWAISTAMPYLDPMEQFVIALIPLVILLMILVGIISYGKPEYEYIG